MADTGQAGEGVRVHFTTVEVFPKCYMNVPMDSDARLGCTLTAPLESCAAFILAS